MGLMERRIRKIQRLLKIPNKLTLAGASLSLTPSRPGNQLLIPEGALPSTFSLRESQRAPSKISFVETDGIRGGRLLNSQTF